MRHRISAWKCLDLSLLTQRSAVRAEFCFPGGFVYHGVEKGQGLYVTGELLDVDGPCGGYNLQWAWSTGARAGAVPEETVKEKGNGYDTDSAAETALWHEKKN